MREDVATNKKKFDNYWNTTAAMGRKGRTTYKRRMVNIVKYSLLGCSLLLLGLLVIFPMMRSEEERFTMNTTEAVATSQATPQMLNPRFQGVDKQGQAYNITADSAMQHSRDNIQLEKVNADIALNNGEWLVMVADTAYMNIAVEKMDLTQNVSIFSDKDYELHTERMLIDFVQGTASSDRKITGWGSLGRIEAEGFIVNNQQETIDFTGPVRLILTMDE